VERRADEWVAVGERIGPRFSRSGPRRRAVGYVRGRLSGVERKNGWPLAEHLDFAAWAGFRQGRVGTLLAGTPAGAWHRLSCGDGAKGPRVYDRALSRTNSPEPDEYARRALIRRSVSDPEDVASFACGGPPSTTLNESVRVAGARWAVEDRFESAKGGCGLDEYEVRGWTGWHRHVTLSPFALAAVAVIRSRVAEPAKKGARSGSRRAPPGCASCSCDWCGTGCQRPSRCWRGRSGGGNTSTGRDAATTAPAGRNRPMGNYGRRARLCGR
jgi:hypothetical protein